MNDDPAIAARAIEAGAKGYIAKNDDPALIVEAVREVGSGGHYLHPRWRARSLSTAPGPTPAQCRA